MPRHTIISRINNGDTHLANRMRKIGRRGSTFALSLSRSIIYRTVSLPIFACVRYGSSINDSGKDLSER